MYSSIAIIILILIIGFLPGIIIIFFVIRILSKQFKNREALSYNFAKELKTTFNLLNYNFYNSGSTKKPLYLETFAKYGKIFIYREFRVYSKEIRTTDYTVQFNGSRFNIQNRIIIIENKSSLIKIFSRIIKRLCKSMFFIVFISVGMVASPLGIVFLYILIPSIIILIISSILFGKYGTLGNIYDTFSRQSMESLGFEKSFDAFSKDPIEARMIITPAFMDRLEQFSNEWNLGGKIHIIWEKDTFTLLLKGDIEKYGKETDGSYTLIKSMEEILNLRYYSLNTNNQ